MAAKILCLLSRSWIFPVLNATYIIEKIFVIRNFKMAGIPKLTGNSQIGDIQRSFTAPDPLIPSMSPQLGESAVEFFTAKRDPKLKNLPGASMRDSLLQMSSSLEDRLLLLAKHPERLALKLLNDPAFGKAYVAFISKLIHINNSSIEIHDVEALKEANELAFNNAEQQEEEWKKSTYDDVLSCLPDVKNPALTVSVHSTRESVKDLLNAMAESPDKPIFWIINGNNDFFTHQALDPILEEIADARTEQSEKGFQRQKDIVLTSGNAAGSTPFGPGLILKFKEKSKDGKEEIVGNADATEAHAIEGLLRENRRVDRHFNFDQETAANNTRENIVYTNVKLREQNKALQDFITVNSQSGLSGLRSGLTLIGAANKENFPTKIHLINPHLDPDSSISMFDHGLTGRTFIQAMREFMNLTSDISRGFFIPPVPLPKELIDKFRICLQKIGIDPASMSSAEVQRLLTSMHETAMEPNKEKVIAQEEYGSGTKLFAQKSKSERAQQNFLQNWLQRRNTT